jgi:glycerol-3-phosphate dehydrogenase (NAD(P)+)
MNARAAIVTRGLAEISRLAIKRGASPLSMGGLCGVGDLVLTCTGSLSRNWTVGNRMAKGETLDEVRQMMGVSHSLTISPSRCTATWAHLAFRLQGPCDR